MAQNRNQADFRGQYFAMGNPILNRTAPLSSSTTANLNLTAANVLSGLVAHNPGTTATNVNLPTAASLVDALGGVNVGDTIMLTIVNSGTTTGVDTLVAGTGGSFDANEPAAGRTVAVGTSRTVFIRFTSATTYVVY